MCHAQCINPKFKRFMQNMQKMRDARNQFTIEKKACNSRLDDFNSFPPEKKLARKIEGSIHRHQIIITPSKKNQVESTLFS